VTIKRNQTYLYGIQHATRHTALVCTLRLRTLYIERLHTDALNCDLICILVSLH